MWVPEYERESLALEPFAVGDYLDWPVFPVDRDDWLERLFQGSRVVVDGIYGTHAADAEIVPVRQSGLVVAVEEVYSEMLKTPINMIAVEVSIAEGKATRQQVKRGDWRPRLRENDGVEFVGYLVTLEP